jgi:hypothetical protein
MSQANATQSSQSQATTTTSTSTTKRYKMVAHAGVLEPLPTMTIEAETPGVATRAFITEKHPDAKWIVDKLERDSYLRGWVGSKGQFDDARGYDPEVMREWMFLELMVLDESGNWSPVSGKTWSDPARIFRGSKPSKWSKKTV